MLHNEKIREIIFKTPIPYKPNDVQKMKLKKKNSTDSFAKLKLNKRNNFSGKSRKINIYAKDTNEKTPPRDPWVCPRQHPMRFAEIWDGRIVLQAGGALTDPADAHLLLHRQKEAAFTQSCVLDASQLTSGMAGLIGYYDENSFVFFGVQKTEDGASALVLMEQIGKERRVRTFDVSDPASIRLACTGKGLNRTYAADEKSVSLSTPYLTDEGLRMGKRFTGAMLGLACSGTGMVCFASYREAFSERFSEHFFE